jgi:hypothetical protein
MSPEDVRRIVGEAVTDAEAAALLEWYAALTRGLEAFPKVEMNPLEPPLRSTPGPRR